MKSKFVVSIEETVVKDFVVYAEDKEEAMETAEKKYRSGEFVLEPGEVAFRQMAIINTKNEVTEWVEF